MLCTTEAHLQHAIVFPTVRYRVLTSSSPGLKLAVAGFPASQTHSGGDQDLLYTQIERTPGSPAFKTLDVTVSGIPGPGPYRWIAVAIAGVFVLGGLVLVFRRAPAPRAADVAMTGVAARKEALLDEAAALEAEREQGRIGPEYHARRRRELLDELAEVLRVEAQAARSASR